MTLNWALFIEGTVSVGGTEVVGARLIIRLLKNTRGIQMIKKNMLYYVLQTDHSLFQCLKRLGFQRDSTIYLFQLMINRLCSLQTGGEPFATICSLSFIDCMVVYSV